MFVLEARKWNKETEYGEPGGRDAGCGYGRPGAMDNMTPRPGGGMIGQPMDTCCCNFDGLNGHSLRTFIILNAIVRAENKSSEKGCMNNLDNDDGRYYV